MLTISVGKSKLLDILFLQIMNNFFLEDKDRESIKSIFEKALDRVLLCFSKNKNKYFIASDGSVLFDPYHSGQYCIFLYIISNELFKVGALEIASKVYYLNKMLNSCDILYAIELPEMFFLEHPVGSVLGRANYGKKFVCHQGCTVGGNGKVNEEVYPVIGDEVCMFANSAIIGDCHIGNNVLISSGVMVKDLNIPDNSIIFNKQDSILIKSMSAEWFLLRSHFYN